MKIFRHVFSTTAFAVLLAGTALAGQAVRQEVSSPAPVAAPAKSRTLPATQALFDSYIATDKMPGIVGGFGVGDFPTQFVGAGKISDTPDAPAAGPDSLWRVYSMTKPVTATAAMILIEQGKIGLDDPVSKYIPEFKHMRVVDGPTGLASHPATHPILIRNLLTHTAGLAYAPIFSRPVDKEYLRLGLVPAMSDAASEAQARPLRPRSLEAFAKAVAAQPLIAEPGTVWSYSIGLDIMGRVIEVASGEPFDRFVQRHIFDPLQLRSSFWTVPQRDAARLATNYTLLSDRRVALDPGATSVWLQPPTFPYGGAGLVMSARDYDRFLHMLQNKGSIGRVRVMKPQTAELMMSNLLPTGVSYTNQGSSNGTTGFGAGGSVVLADSPDGAPKGTYAWGGAAGSKAWVNPITRTRGTIMVNYFPGEKYPVLKQTMAALLTDAAHAK